jgi:hypothetical protein
MLRPTCAASRRRRTPPAPQRDPSRAPGATNAQPSTNGARRRAELRLSARTSSRRSTRQPITAQGRGQRRQRLTTCLAARVNGADRAAGRNSNKSGRVVRQGKKQRSCWSKSSHACCLQAGLRSPEGIGPQRERRSKGPVAVLCCCTPARTDSNYAPDLWSYGDSNSGPLACHQQAARPPASITAGHRPRPYLHMHRHPGRLLYFTAVLPRSRRPPSTLLSTFRSYSPTAVAHTF